MINSIIQSTWTDTTDMIEDIQIVCALIEINGNEIMKWQIQYQKCENDHGENEENEESDDTTEYQRRHC